MFYSQVILARKGPLGKIWIAAHFDKRLTKNQIFATDITSSVDSVMNPSSPLALRVSGHLMLGIVRIYSRKVKYLMSDCTEAMWKIKLAFRPGNVDIDPNLMNGINIDDAKHFGSVTLEDEFPELENTAFPQFLLTGFESTKGDCIDAGYGSQPSVNSGISSYSLNNYDFVASSPLLGGGKAKRVKSNMGIADRELDTAIGGSLQSVGSSNPVNNDIELMRDERSRSMDSHHRISLSSLKGGRPSGISMVTGFEEDDMVPAFEDQQDETFGSFGDNNIPEIALNSGNAFSGSYKGGDEQTTQNSAEYGDTENATRSPQGVDEMKETSVDSDMGVVPQENTAETEGTGAAHGTRKELGGTAATGVSKRRANKRYRVLLDDRVELPNRIIKQRMADMGPILRKSATQELPFQTNSSPDPITSLWNTELFKSGCRTESSLEQRIALPSRVKGLCSELQEVFSMSINEAPLPFPLKNAVSPLINTQTTHQSIDGNHEATQNSIELMRAPRDSDVYTDLVDTAGGPRRYSRLDVGNDFRNSQSSYNTDAVGHDAGGHIPRYSDASRLAGGNADSIEQASWDAHDDFGAGLGDLTDRSLSMSHGGGDVLEGAMEELKVDDSDTIHHHSEQDAVKEIERSNRQIKALPANSASKAVSDMFERGVPESATNNTIEKGNSAPGFDRTVHDKLFKVIKRELETKPSVSFSNLSAGVSKRAAACCFLEVLQLKTWGQLQTNQNTPFADILISTAQ